MQIFCVNLRKKFAYFSSFIFIRFLIELENYGKDDFTTSV